jgi:hypothetical protein
MISVQPDMILTMSKYYKAYKISQLADFVPLSVGIAHPTILKICQLSFMMLIATLSIH